MNLPLPVLRQLAEPLRSVAQPREFRNSHNLPIHALAWERHGTAVARAIDEFAGLLQMPNLEYAPLRGWVSHLVESRRAVISMLLAAEPFQPFEVVEARNLVSTLNWSIVRIADALERGQSTNIPRKRLERLGARWSAGYVETDQRPVVQRAFDTDQDPYDDEGDFRADWILQHYGYRTGALVKRLVPLQESLGVPGVTDTLAAVSLIGWILDSVDPITSYVAMDAFIDASLSADETTANRVGEQLLAAEPSLTRARRLARQARNRAADDQDVESRALALAEAYKRTVEGPFRQFSWGLYCLRQGIAGRAPTLSQLRDRLSTGSALLRSVAELAVIPDLRNSEAHETLHRDGFAGEFVTESSRIPPARVADALATAESFSQGCEAGLVAVRSLAVQPSRALPKAGEEGRMVAWRRALAFFGTNRLRVTKASLNSQDALIAVERLELGDVNPCFQALVLSHRMLPEVETFTVSLAGDGAKVISVAAEDLERTMPIWEYAVSNLDRMPFCAFLPANLAARLSRESASAALRSLAWIAVDDCLDAIDGSPEQWDTLLRTVLLARLKVVEIAVNQVLGSLDETNPRLTDVLKSAVLLRQELGSSAPTGPDVIEKLPVLARLRHQWETWGPVPRLPGIEGSGVAEVADEPQPGLLPAFDSYAYRTL